MPMAAISSAVSTASFTAAQQVGNEFLCFVRERRVEREIGSAQLHDA
jgi:hypothetical protein